jgi:2-oxoglutarate/2-oxoacid ferredoxin oxidoreductase subunit beta
MQKIFSRPASMSGTPFLYCSGCGHSIVHRLMGELFDELRITDRVIAVAPVGCAVTAYDYFNVDFCEAAHGRAAAVATGIKRVSPEKIVVSYQGDGDLAAIGLAETMHAANRGENITVIFINNSIYGMTGGQMAPTTLVGQLTTTSPSGRNAANEGDPLKMAEMIASLEAPAYVVRTAVNNAVQINKTRKFIENALKLQIEGKGYSLIEVLSQCPTNLGLTPMENNSWIENELMKYFKLGIMKNRYNI